MKIKECFLGDHTYFTADLHIGHKNALTLGSGCPFENVPEMNNFIKEGLQKLKSDDTLFELGDLFWGMQPKECKEFFDGIPCKNIYKVMGNHDKEGLYYYQAPLKDCFKGIYDILDIKVQDESGKIWMVNLCHYPILDFNHMWWGGIHIHGHCHGSLDDWEKSEKKPMFDTGFTRRNIELFGSSVISFNDIIKYLKYE